MLLAAPALAQRGRTMRVDVTVQRDSGTPIEGATVIVRKNGSGAIALGHTNSLGKVSVRFPGDTGAFELVVQRLGFTQVRGPLALDEDIKKAIVILRPVAQRIAGIQVDARPLPKEYKVSATDIAAEKRPLYTALDIIKKMRPEMRGDRRKNCPLIDNIWINNERVWNHLPLDHTPPPIPRDSLITTINAAHVEEMHYSSCWEEGRDEEMGMFDALFITLKLGYTWDLKHGSYYIGVDTVRTSPRE
jgi:hypothetical protein